MNKHLGRIGRFQFNFIFEPRDLWVGVYRAKRYVEMGSLYRPLYISVIPTLVLLVTVEIEPQRYGDDL